MVTRASAGRAADKATRRAAILAVAMELVAKKRLENVTFGMIARRAGTSRPLVYFYFPTMRSLMEACVLEACAGLFGFFGKAMAQGGTGYGRILGIGRAYVAFSREQPVRFAMLMHLEACIRHEGARGGQFRDIYDRIMGLMVDAIEQGRRDGSISREIREPAKVAACLWGMTHGLIVTSREHGRTVGSNLKSPFEDMPEFGLDILARAFRPSAPLKAGRAQR
jgi:AcrR family transcriptional regulator